MDVLRVEVALLRAALPDLILRPGMTLPARVLERAGQHGLLLLAGTPLSAELPDDVPAGARLRLRVEEVGHERVVLRAVETPAAGTQQAHAPAREEPAARAAQPAQMPPPDVALPLPGGRQAEVRVTERASEERQAGEPASVGLAYESPALGTLDMRIVHQPGAGMQVTVGAMAGMPEAEVRRAAEELRAALSAATGLPATVRVVARPPEQKVDLYV
ncbi:MAG: hypothetical protein QOD81_67 [Solirubrobacteraceae bacterium]|jgi:hypothetical protein|nr:hypothetical protein [Solirubrobacteraceae bacterium]